MLVPMGSVFEIGGERVQPGQAARLDLPIARLVSQQMLSLPIVVLHGKRPGPTIWLSAAIHGDEINGTEVIRRVVQRIKLDELSGTVLAVPVVNVWGLINQSRYLPDRRDLNRSFPGSATGSLASQMAHLFLNEVVSRSDVGIDLHTGSLHRTNLPQTRADLGDERLGELCHAFRAPVTLHAKLREGSLRHAAARLEVPCMLVEAGESHRFTTTAVRACVRGVLRVMRHMRMIRSAPTDPPTRIARSARWLRATRSGIAHLTVGLGDPVEEGAVVAVIRDPYGDVAGRVRAKESGIVIGLALNPLTNRGDALLNVAHLEDED
jgi:predicted deacylase